jgi:putative OPT family oligopeptide transporter
MATTEPLPYPPLPAARPERREATVRALAAGCGIGAILAAGNVYTALKTGFIDGGGITAALLGFMMFSGVKALARRRYGLLENNITQTTAASAAIMGFVVGLPGPVPALDFIGALPPAWVIAVWGLATGVLGILAAVILRRQLIVDDALAFPTGAATAEVIETIHATRGEAVRRVSLLAGAAAIAMLVTWFRDGSPKLVPQATAFGGTIAGIATARLTFGVSWSPLLLSTGALVGLRGGASMLLGGGLAWGVFAPWLLNAGIIREAEYGPLTTWLVWPALGILAAGSFLPLLLDIGGLRRSFRDLGALVRRGSGAPPATSAGPAPIRSRTLLLLFLASVVTLAMIGRAQFGLGVAPLAIAIVLALLLANVCARATGETDVGPAGPMGTLTQAAFTSSGAVTSVVTGSVSSGSATQVTQTLYALHVGHRLGASIRAQVGAQLLGAALGAVVVVPIYFLLARTYGIGTEALPAAGAQSWKAMAEAARGGVAGLPPHAMLAGALGLAAGAALTLAGRTRIGRFLPSPAAMGLGMLVPASYSFAIFAGAIAVAAARRMRPSLSESDVMTVAAGGMAGESLMGVVIAALVFAGIL